ncbi:unnamed protein product [Brachionus calyciflorus]|uniref:RBR-type E3 ubiquitin transferase n=1 Tax=Brachionus calyciflorus TaxID=104777 RepID=A0A814HDU4_9BILA|nr:unnamed protein product [Brachionus calyciflorus]
MEAYNELNDKIIPENINGYGRMHIETNFIYEFRIPTKASKILNLNSLMNQLKESSKFSFDFRENFDKKDNDLFIVKSIDQNLLDKMVEHLNKIIKPASIKLPYFKYDKIRKYLNNTKKQSKLEKDNNIFIHKNQKLNQISIYGLPEISKKILDDLLKEIENLDSKKIEINVRSFKAIIGENGKTYKELCENFHGEIQLDYKNKKIIFTSKESQIEEFKNKIDKIQNQYLKTHKIDCVICQSSLESPFQLIMCGHTFCKECLKGQILNYSSSCIICNQEFCINEIRTILDESTSDLDDVCSKALNNFIIRNAIFKYCDECNEIFCRETLIERYCKPCDEKITKEKRQMENILSENFIASSFKKCPGCNLHIEKNHGCNHMTCFVCETHFCWLCLFTGNNSDVIYEHLKKVHGGIFDVPLDLV